MLSASRKDAIVQVSGRLERLVEDREGTSLTVQAHKDYLVRIPHVSAKDVSAKDVSAKRWRRTFLQKIMPKRLRLK